MTAYATRLVNGTDTREHMRAADALHMFPSGPGVARGGLRNDGGGVVTVNAGAMTVNVSPFTGWVDGGVSDLQGGYTFVSDATEVLTVANGHGSLSRTDVVIAEVRDTTHDASGSTDARVRILQGTAGGGTPALPTNALALRNITVPAGLSVGTGGLSAGNLSTDRRTFTTGLGGVLTVASQAERDALPAINGTQVYRTDLDRLEIRTAGGWEGQEYGYSQAAIPAAGTVYRRGGQCTAVVNFAHGAVSATQTLFQVPSGYWPLTNHYFQAVKSSTAGAMALELTTSGFVNVILAHSADSVLFTLTYPIDV